MHILEYFQNKTDPTNTAASLCWEADG